jgi:hypothetical protein
MNCKDNDVSQFVNTLLKKYFINYAKALTSVDKIYINYNIGRHILLLQIRFNLVNWC